MEVVADVTKLVLEPSWQLPLNHQLAPFSFVYPYDVSYYTCVFFLFFFSRIRELQTVVIGDGKCFISSSD